MELEADPRFAGVRGLGRFRKRYRSARIFPFAGALFALLMLGPLVFHVLSPGRLAGAAIADVLFSVIGAPLVIWLFWRHSGETVALYQRGFACYRQGRLVQVGWDDVCRLYVCLAPMPYSREDVGRRYCVETRRGALVELSGLAHIEELWEVIGNEVDGIRDERQKLKIGKRSRNPENG
jgi:hypothetical protein